MSISKNLVSIIKRINSAGEQSTLNSVKLIAVTKTVPIDKIEEAIQAGITAIGENRVQEAAEKKSVLEKYSLEWHMIGHLQSNKAAQAAEIFDYIHSLDSIKLAEKLNNACINLDKKLKVLIQINLSRESSKSGCTVEDLNALVSFVNNLSNLELVGLMTVPPFSNDPEDSRPYFKQLKDLANKYSFSELSMGMTNDFEVAVEEGSTMVRIGTAIFGKRS